MSESRPGISFKSSWPPVSENGKIPTLEFLEACDVIIQVFGMYCFTKNYPIPYVRIYYQFWQILDYHFFYSNQSQEFLERCLFPSRRTSREI
jgi:hypothetical protein